MLIIIYIFFLLYIYNIFIIIIIFLNSNVIKNCLHNNNTQKNILNLQMQYNKKINILINKKKKKIEVIIFLVK